MNKTPNLNCLDIDVNSENYQYRSNAFSLEVKDEFLAFYMNQNWTPLGLPKAVLDASNSGGSISLNEETTIRINYLKNMQRKMNLFETLRGDARDIQTFNADYQKMLTKFSE